MSACTPRSAASAGALTNVTGSSMTAENSPRSAESRSTPTSSEASSPRTCTDSDTGSSVESTPTSTPSLRTRSSHGATSSPTTPPPTLTASGTNSPASASFTLSATSVPARSCASRRPIRVVCPDVRTDRRQPLRHQLADAAEPDDADGLAVDLGAGELRPLPGALAQRRVGRGDLTGRRQQQRQRVLGGAV